MKATRRVLLLSSSTGSGHDMRAQAVEEWIARLAGNTVAVHREQIIENSSALGRFGVWVYNTIQRYQPWLHNLYFFIVEGIVWTHRGRVSFGGRYYRRLLRQLQPHLILSLHDSTNRGYFEEARSILGTHVFCATYCGEFSGGFGYSRNWINPTADLFIARTEEARDFAVRKGMPRERTAVFRTLLPPAALAATLTEERKNALLHQLGFSRDRFTLFLATGGYGANHHRAFLRAVLALHRQLQVIVVCGRNQRAYRQLHGFSQQHPDLPMHLEGYSNRVHQFLQIADAVVSRGGANTTMEALHFQCPLLYDAIGGLMPQERCTTRFVVARGAGCLLQRPSDLARRLELWLRGDAEFRRIRDALARLAVKEDPATRISSLLNTSGIFHSNPSSPRIAD